MSEPYGEFPDALSEANDWHKFTFMISIDQPVDWNKVDLRRWAQMMAKYTAIIMGSAGLTEEEIRDLESIKTLMMDVKVSRVTLATDDQLHNLIDGMEGDDVGS